MGRVLARCQHLVNVGKMLLCCVVDSVKPLTEPRTHQTLFAPLVRPLSSL